MATLTATYSPEDNKLRLYASSRLDAETYARVKAAGFKWAPKQDLFVAPMWTPGRYALLESLCGEVGDEDTSLVQRAEDRAERFDEYSDKRLADAKRAAEAVQTLTDGIPFGQPILVGHHSQRRAEKDAERIENGMKKAVKMWETSKYWESRAAGAIAHAKYKEAPEVRARRIKTIEAEKRGYERTKAECVAKLAFWSREDITLEEAISFCNSGFSFYMPRKDTDKPDFNQSPNAYTCLTNDYPNLYGPRTLQEVIDAGRKCYPVTIKNAEAWISHCENRLTYEKAMLNEQGAAHLIEKKPRPKLPPICNYAGEVTIKGHYGNPPKTYTMHHMTKAEYAAQVRGNHTGTWTAVDGSHRVKVALIHEPGKPYYMGSFCPVFITDAKVTPAPAAKEP